MSYELFEQYMKENDALDDYDMDGAYKLYQKYYKVLSSKYLKNWMEKYVNDKNQKVLYYMYTFTLKPEADKVRAKEYIESIANRQENLNIRELAYCIEHPDTNMHFHVLIGSTRALRVDAFKQYQKNYGFVQRSRKIGSTSIQIADYISKDTIPIYLIKDGKRVYA